MRHASLKSNQEVGMRGDESIPDDMFSYVRPEQRVPADHPLRPIRTLVDEVLRDLSPRFARLYAKTGRPSIPPEKLLRALLLQTLYSIRSERQLMEQLDFNILYRWFVGLSLDAPVWDVTVFTKNRERLLAGTSPRPSSRAVVQQAQARQLLSPEHFTVDGTLIEAWAGLKSFTRRDTVPPPGRSGQSHGGLPWRAPLECHPCLDDRSRGAADAQRPGPGSQAQLPRACPDGEPAWAGGRGPRDAGHGHGRARGGGGDGPTPAARRDARGRQGLRHPRLRRGAPRAGASPRMSRRTPRTARSAIDGRTTRHPGYAVSQQKRKLVEEIFGWLKTVALLRKTRHRGVRRVGLDVHLRGRRLQPGADPQPDRGGSPHMTTRTRPSGPRLSAQRQAQAPAWPGDIASRTVGINGRSSIFRSLLGPTALLLLRPHFDRIIERQRSSSD